MLDALVGIVAGLLVLASLLVVFWPQAKVLLRRARAVRPPRSLPDLPRVRPARETGPPALNPKTQRVLLSATRLAQWLRAHGQEDIAREIRAAAGKLATDEASGLYAMQTALRRVRTIALDDRSAHERLRILSTDLRKAVQDRFEQLELLPFGKL
jgi:hypothetical protein